MATILTATEVAKELGTDSRTVRKFLRSVTPADAQPGKGKRWGVEKKQLRSLRTKFVEFERQQAEQRKAREAVNALSDAADQIGDDAAKIKELAHEVIESLDLLEGPTDEELAELDSED